MRTSFFLAASHRRLVRMPALPLVAALLAACAIGVQARTWNSPDGSETFEGELQSYDPATGMVGIVLPDGKKLLFSQDKLSAADIAFLKGKGAIAAPAPNQEPAEEAAGQKPPAHAVEMKDVERVSTLFKQNGLSLDGLLITRVISLGRKGVGKGEGADALTVHVQLLHHNIPVVGSGSTVVFSFKNGKLSVPDGSSPKDDLRKMQRVMAGLQIELKPSITRRRAIEGLRKHVSRDPEPGAKDQAEGKMEARLAILKTESMVKNPEKYVLVWEAHAVEGTIHAYIDATSGKMLLYGNGINY